MRNIQLRILGVVTSLALIAAAAGFAPFASAASGGPTVVLSSTSTTTTNAASIPITATFSEPVTGVGLSGLDLTNATASDLSGSGAVYTFDIAPVAQGSASVMIPSDFASSTASSTGNQASNTLTFTYDTVAPVIAQVTGIASTSASATPSFTFSSTEAGAIGLTGGCTSTSTMALSGNNTITFRALGNGSYDCSLSVMDTAGNTSNVLPIDFAVAVASSSAPTVTSITPTSGSTAGGSMVTITGTGFTGATAVDFGSTPATAMSVVGDTSITATAPSGTGTADVTVMTPAGTSATSSSDQFTYMAPTAPTISDIAVTLSGTHMATISWMTDAAASSQVFYGTSASYGSASTLDTMATTTHSVTISGLLEATLYHFDVVSTDAAGSATSSDQVFTSGSSASTTPLTLIGVTPVSTTATADGTFADGFQWVLHFLVPTVETSFQMKFADFTTPSSSGTIPAASNILYFSPESSNASTSASAMTETGNGFGGVLNLSGGISTTSPGRLVDVTVETAVPVGTPTGVYSTIFGAFSTTTP